VQRTPNRPHPRMLLACRVGRRHKRTIYKTCGCALLCYVRCSSAQTFQAHESAVQSIALARDSKLIHTGSKDGTLKVSPCQSVSSLLLAKGCPFPRAHAHRDTRTHSALSTGRPRHTLSDWYPPSLASQVWDAAGFGASPVVAEGDAGATALFEAKDAHVRHTGAMGLFAGKDASLGISDLYQTGACMLPAAACCYCLLLRACGLLLLRVDACGKWRASLCLTQISTFVATTDFHRQAISCGADGRIVLWKTPQ
jgi:hypothetical protein